MRFLPFIVIAAAVCAAPAQARSKDVLSWGKAGVSFEDYRSDAVTCGRQGYYLDIAATEQAQALVKASRLLESNESNLTLLAMSGDVFAPVGIVAMSRHIIDNARPDMRIRQLRQMMNDTVATCLAQHGYKQFRLTDMQKKELKRLKQGTAERHAYLYSLGSDAMVLADQAV